MLDEFENLPMSLKWVADAVCSLLVPGKAPGQADRHPGIKISALQRRPAKNEVAGVEITVEETQ
jgi:hypothetical protein